MLHGLGPHVVGQRVVVRRVLAGETGPTGGPAMTDVLGICLAWGDGTCVVEREDGTRVSIRTADIVSGKPVPPRPSPRLRVDPTTAQRRAMTLFADLETTPLGDWVLRRSVVHAARRANSVLAFAPAGPNTTVEAVAAFYDAHGQRPIAAVLPGSDEESLFVERGWVPESGDADTVFQLAGVAAARRALGRRVRPHHDGVDVDVREDGDHVTVRLGEVASGMGALAGDWVGYRSIVVDAAHRRQGLGLAVMAALLEWGASRGATTAYLQVLGDNAPALALYDRLGFVEHHRYRYLARPRSTGASLRPRPSGSRTAAPSAAPASPTRPAPPPG